MDLPAFYQTVSGLSFTLLGLWWVVAQRHQAWFFERNSRRLAYIVSLHFMVPGATSLLSLVDPRGTFWWRLVFAIAGILGLLGAVLASRTVNEEYGRRQLAAGLLVVAIPVYLLFTLIAIVPNISAAIDVAARQVEGVLTAMVLLLGLNAAWFLTMEPTAAEREHYAATGKLPDK